jgi:hypothetical protein
MEGCRRASENWKVDGGPTLTMRLRARSAGPVAPAPIGEVPYASIGNDDALCKQQGALGKQVAPVAAQLAAGRNDTMAGDRRVACCAHDVADGAMRARAARCGGNVAVGRDLSAWDATNDGADSRSEIRRSRHWQARESSHHWQIGRLADWQIGELVDYGTPHPISGRLDRRIAQNTGYSSARDL